MADMCEWDSVGYGNTAFIFLLEDNVGRILVDPNAKALKLILDDLFVCERFVDIKDNKDEMACFSHRNNLTTSTFAVLSSLDDTRQIEHLNCGAIVLNLTRYSSQSSEFIGSS